MKTKDGRTIHSDRTYYLKNRPLTGAYVVDIGGLGVITCIPGSHIGTGLVKPHEAYSSVRSIAEEMMAEISEAVALFESRMRVLKNSIADSCNRWENEP